MQTLQFEQTGMDTMIESDRESNKSDDGTDTVQKEQSMFVWSSKYEVAICSIELTTYWCNLHPCSVSD